MRESPSRTLPREQGGAKEDVMLQSSLRCAWSVLLERRFSLQNVIDAWGTTLLIFVLLKQLLHWEEQALYKLLISLSGTQRISCKVVPSFVVVSHSDFINRTPCQGNTACIICERGLWLLHPFFWNPGVVFNNLIIPRFY